MKDVCKKTKNDTNIAVFYFRYQKSKVKHHFLYKILIRKILIAEVFFTLECLKGGYICYGAVLYRLLENYLVGKKVRY